MDEVLRQRDPALKDAVLHMIARDPALAVEGLGNGVLEMDADALGESAARLWLELGAGARAGTEVLAPTHRLRAEINAAVRTGLAAEGVLHGRVLAIERYVNLHLTRAQKSALLHAVVEPLDDGRCHVAAEEALQDRPHLAGAAGADHLAHRGVDEEADRVSKAPDDGLRRTGSGQCPFGDQGDALVHVALLGLIENQARRRVRQGVHVERALDHVAGDRHAPALGARLRPVPFVVGARERMDPRGESPAAARAHPSPSRALARNASAPSIDIAIPGTLVNSASLQRSRSSTRRWSSRCSSSDSASRWPVRSWSPSSSPCRAHATMNPEKLMPAASARSPIRARSTGEQ